MKKGYCKICENKDIVKINAMLLDGATNTSIVKRFGLNFKTLKKHKENCISVAIAKKQKETEELIEDNLLKNVQDKIQFLDKIIMGCHEYLLDPDDNTKYYLGARGDEIDVVYREKTDNGRLSPMQKKATLQSLTDAIHDDGHYVVMNMTSKHSDPRDLLIKGVSELKQVVKMLIDSTQHMYENQQKNKAIAKAASTGGSISFEKEVEKITERVTIALQGSNAAELSEIAGLPPLDH